MQQRNLADIFTIRGLLRDTDDDGVADGVNASFEVSGGLGSWAGALEVAARLGLESTGLTLPLVGGNGGVPVRIGPGLVPDLRPGTSLVTWAPDGALVITGGDDMDVCRAARELAAGVAPEAAGVTGEAEKAPAPLDSLEHLFTADCALQFALSPRLGRPELSALVDQAARMGVEATSVRFPVTLLPGEQGHGGPVLSVPPEGNGAELTAEGVTIRGAEMVRYLANQPDLAPPVWVHAHPGAPEPETEAVRWEWQGASQVDRFWELWDEQVAPELTGGPVQVDLRISAPRAARQELQDLLLRRLGEGSQVQVRSCFKQGYHWLEEEVLPGLVGKPVAQVKLAYRRFISRAPEGEPVLDLPTRWLQECYPADALFERELGLPAANFALAMVEEGPTYRLTALDTNGAVIGDFTYEATTGLRRYLDAFPERGWVHPPSGSLTVNGRQYGPLLTDIHLLWDWYQGEVLPGLRRYIQRTHGESPALTAQPLFGTLRFDVWLSDENRRLGLREEQVSPLDALHEDLYFVTLDEMATWGRALHGQPFGAPGMILPCIHQVSSDAAPRATVTLTAKREVRAVPAGRPVVAMRPDTLTFADGMTVARQTTSLPAPQVDRIPLDVVIGPEQLPDYLVYLAALPGVRVWQAGVSYLGRPLHAIEVRPATGERIQPLRKASAHRPTLLINARHHANEVSSTNAVLRLVEMVAKGEGEAAALARKVNLVILPLENMDGAAIHYELMQEHPTWKLHAARFNAAGLEFYGQYIDPETPYTEARALPRLFQQSLPDILLDDHGVPSHEWIQPFAGYNSAPYFRVSYWLPNALLYGIFRDLDPEKYPHQVAATRALRERLTSRVRAHPLVYGENQAWLETYQKWGTAWDEKRFPLTLQDGMICYNWPAGAHAFSVRYPETCVIDWVTEVPDETAKGEHLVATAEAHLAGHLACLDFLAAHPQPVSSRTVQVGRAAVRTVGRQRPFQL